MAKKLSGKSKSGKSNPPKAAKPLRAKPAPKNPSPKKAKPAPSGAATPAPPPSGCPAVRGLVIGCDFYLPNSTDEGSYESLHGCVRDAQRVVQFLRNRAGLTDDNLILLTSTPGSGGAPKEPPDQRPTYENIVNGFRELTKRSQPGDHVYVHYSGHGGRCPTIVPDLKGPDGLDESLVPIDIGDKSARYVRDIEIAKLLKEMGDKGLIATIVFDSCHAGGAIRAVRRTDEPVGIRGVTFVDRTKRPTGSLVGTPAQLAAAVSSSVARASATRGIAATAEVGQTVVLAACRPSELAREFPFENGESQGALTYWFLNALGQSATAPTFRTVFDQIQARIHGQFPAQTPMLFGNPDRLVLDGGLRPSKPSVPINSVAPDGKTLALGSGLAGLVQTGLEFTIYPADVTEPTEAARVALVEVTASGPAESKASVTKLFGTRAVQVGDRAIPAGVAQKLVRKVLVARPDGNQPGAADKALKQIAPALQDASWIQIVTDPSEAADFVVTTKTSQAGDHYQICDASGVEFVIRPEVTTTDPAGPKTVAARLVHLARYFALRQLDNQDSLSPLRGKIDVALLKTPSGYKEGDPLTKLKPFPTGRPAQVQPGEWVVLSVTNKSAGAVNAVAFDLSSDWSVAVAHPSDPFFPIDPNGAQWLLPLQASLPEGLDVGKDNLKVFVTVDPPPAYELLTLPALDNPIPPASKRGPKTRSTNPLNALVDAVSADRPTRALSTGSQVGRGWMVAHAEVEVRKP